MKKTTRIITCGVSIFILISLASRAGYATGGDEVSGNVIIFPVSAKNIQLSALVQSCEEQVSKVFNGLGRFIPVEKNTREYAVNEALKTGSENIYKKAGAIIGADLVVVIRLYHQVNKFVAVITIQPLGSTLDRQKVTFSVQSRIAAALPYKVAREIAYYHKNVPLTMRVIQKQKRLTVLSAGQWHGIRPGRYKTRSGGSITVIECGRYRCYARTGNRIKPGDILVLDEYVDCSGVINEMDKTIDAIIVNRYAIGNNQLKGIDAEKRFLKSMCIINTGANFCLPGYGAYLSTGYIGLNPQKPDMVGLVLSSGLVITHFALPEIMTGFEVNFFPWVKDSDKSESMQNLQKFLWLSLPLTFSSSFLNQMAYQCEQTRVLPPFFNNRDSAAAVFSLLFPGGGLFYKGHSLPGWGYYFTEMISASYGFYYFNDPDKRRYAFITLGIIKAIEVVNAYLIGPSYSFYQDEQGRDEWERSFSFNMIPGQDRELVYNCTLSVYF